MWYRWFAGSLKPTWWLGGLIRGRVESLIKAPLIRSARKIDRHVLMTLILRAWSILAGAVTVVVIPLWLSPTQQGYFYTFSSIVALQVFFELGLGQVVIQIVAHEAVHLIKPSGGEHGAESREAQERLGQLQVLLRRWYLPISILFAAILSVVGLIFFQDGELPWSQWLLPWVLLVTASALNLYLSWKLSIVEGFAYVSEIAQLRLSQSLVGYLLMWVGLANGYDLWVVAAVPFTAAAFTTLWLRTGRFAGILNIPSHEPSRPISWKKNIFPLQWRIALSWVSGYFVFQLFTPLAFMRFGAIEAGRLGLTLSIFSAICNLGYSWSSAKAPTLSMLIATNNSADLIELFKKTLQHSIFFTAMLVGFVLIVAWTATELKVDFINRVSSIWVLLTLGAATVGNCTIFSCATFMRAHRAEPMLGVSVVSGALIAMLAWYGSYYGIVEMVLGYSLVTLFIGLPWTIILCRVYVKRHK